MSRSVLFVACLLGALFIALCQGYGDNGTVALDTQSQVVTTNKPASSVPSLMVWPHVEVETSIGYSSVNSASKASSELEATAEQRTEASLLTPYIRPPHVNAFAKRRSSDRTAVATYEEQMQMIKELKEKIDQADASGHYRHSQWIAIDLRTTRIEVVELGEEHVQKLVNLAQRDIARHAKSTEETLAKGCTEDALQTLVIPMGIHRAVLGQRVSSEYLDNLMDRIISSIPLDDDSGARWISYEDRKRYLGCG